MRTAALLLAALAALPSLAQEALDIPPPVPEVSVPPPPPQVSAPTLPPAFFERFVQVDYRGKAYLGRERTPLSRLDLFALAGRPDLVQRSEHNVTKRVVYTVSAVALGALTLGGAVALYLSGPDLTGLACNNSVKDYQACTATARARGELALGTLLLGGVGTGVLAALAVWADPNVLTADEAIELASKYNAQLARSLKQSGLMLTPAFGPGQVGLVARGTFP